MAKVRRRHHQLTHLHMLCNVCTIGTPYIVLSYHSTISLYSPMHSLCILSLCTDSLQYTIYIVHYNKGHSTKQLDYDLFIVFPQQSNATLHAYQLFNKYFAEKTKLQNFTFSLIFIRFTSNFHCSVHPHFKVNVNDAVWLKNTLFLRFFWHGCIASHVASDQGGGGVGGGGGGTMEILTSLRPVPAIK